MAIHNHPDFDRWCETSRVTDTEGQYLRVRYWWQHNREGLKSKGCRKRAHIPPTPAQEHPLRGKALLVPTVPVLPVPFCLTAGHVTAAGVMDGAGVPL